MKIKRRFSRFIKGLKLRLVLGFVFLGLVPVFVMSFGLISSYAKRAIDMRSIDILSQAKIISDQIANSGYLDDISNDSINSRLELISNVYDGRILVIDSTFHIIKDTYDIDTSRVIISEEVANSFQGNESSKYDSVNRYIETTVPIKEQKNGKVIGSIIVSVSTDNVRDTQNYLRNNAFFLSLFVFGGVLIISITFATFYAKPFIKLSKQIGDMKGGYAVEELAITNFTETEDISKNFNSFVGRMKLLDESRQEFVSNVSHELKTPLTSMKVLADSLNGQEGMPLELYKEFMADIGAEIERENKIISDLLDLVKMDKASEGVKVENVNINDLLELIMKRITPIANKAGVELVLESFRPVVAEVDETKLSLAFTNLIENAVKYNDKEDGWVHVSLNSDHEYFFVKVEDNGMGMPDSALEHIYERFYRVDKSHSREIGGTGLGLAITKNVVNLLKGEIKVYSSEGEGTVFTVRIPLTYVK